MQIGGRAFDRHALPRNERALELQAIGLRVAGVCHELSELRVTFAIDEGRVDDALHTLLPGVEGGQVNTQLVVQEVALEAEFDIAHLFRVEERPVRSGAVARVEAARSEALVVGKKVIGKLRSGW